MKSQRSMCVVSQNDFEGQHFLVTSTLCNLKILNEIEK